MAQTVRRFLTAVVSGILVLFLGYQILGPSGYLALRQREREKALLEDEIHGLALENQQLMKQVKALRSDPQAVERVAREEMKLVRPGEVIYLLPSK